MKPVGEMRKRCKYLNRSLRSLPGIMERCQVVRKRHLNVSRNLEGSCLSQYEGAMVLFFVPENFFIPPPHQAYKTLSNEALIIDHGLLECCAQGIMLGCTELRLVRKSLRRFRLIINLLFSSCKCRNRATLDVVCSTL